MPRKRRALNAGLTEKETRFYHILRDYILTNGFAPTVRELSELSGLSSTASVYAYLKQLEINGYIKRDFNSPRKIKLLKENDKLSPIPVFDLEGLLEPNQSPIDFIQFSRALVEDCADCYFIRSMETIENKSIQSKDLLLIAPNKKATIGELALVKDRACAKLLTVSPRTKDLKQLGKIKYVLREI